MWLLLIASFALSCSSIRSQNVSALVRTCPGRVQFDKCTLVMPLNSFVDPIGKSQEHDLNLVTSYLLSNRDLRVHITAHTTSLNSRKTEFAKTEEILALIEKQLSRRGVDRSRLYLEALGADRPRFDPEHLKINQRVEFSFYSYEEGTEPIVY